MSKGDDVLAEARKAFAPVFAAQRETWAREGPAVMARAESLGIKIDEIGGNCPVQAEGSFDGCRFYFRARYEEWQFHAWPGELRYLDRDRDQDGEWEIERDYGGGFDASWMPQHEAVGFICDAVTEYRAAHTGDAA